MPGDKPSSPIPARVVHCGDHLEHLEKLSAWCVLAARFTGAGRRMSGQVRNSAVDNFGLFKRAALRPSKKLPPGEPPAPETGSMNANLILSCSGLKCYG